MVEFEDAASERMAQLEQEDLELYRRDILRNSSNTYIDENPSYDDEFQSKLSVLMDMVRGCINDLQRTPSSTVNGFEPLAINIQQVSFIDDVVSCNHSDLRSKATDELQSDEELVLNESPEPTRMLDFNDNESNETANPDEMHKFAEPVVSESGLHVLSIYCAHMATKWSPVLDSQPIQGNDMSVGVYYDRFYEWKKKLDGVGYIGGEESYIDDFLYGLKKELAVRVWEKKWKSYTLYGAFRRAEIVENMMKNDADKVFEETPHLNSSDIQEAENVTDEYGNVVLEASMGSELKIKESFMEEDNEPRQLLLQKPTGLDEGNVVDEGVVLSLTDLQAAYGSFGDTIMNSTSNGSAKSWLTETESVIEVVLGQNAMKKDDSIMVDEIPPTFQVDAKNEQLMATYIRGTSIAGLQGMNVLLMFIFDPGINSLPPMGCVPFNSCEMPDSSAVVLCIAKVIFCFNLDGCCLSYNDCNHCELNIDLDADLEVNGAIDEVITEVYLTITSPKMGVNVLDAVVLSLRIGSTLFHVQTNEYCATSIGGILGKAGLSLRPVSSFVAYDVDLESCSGTWLCLLSPLKTNFSWKPGCFWCDPSTNQVCRTYLDFSCVFIWLSLSLEIAEWGVLNNIIKTSYIEVSLSQPAMLLDLMYLIFKRVIIGICGPVSLIYMSRLSTLPCCSFGHIDVYNASYTVPSMHGVYHIYATSRKYYSILRIPHYVLIYNPLFDHDDYIGLRRSVLFLVMHKNIEESNDSLQLIFNICPETQQDGIHCITFLLSDGVICARIASSSKKAKGVQNNCIIMEWFVLASMHFLDRINGMDGNVVAFTYHSSKIYLTVVVKGKVFVNLKGFAWDPGICATFFDIIEDNDVFKRVGKKVLRMVMISSIKDEVVCQLKIWNIFHVLQMSMKHERYMLHVLIKDLLSPGSFFRHVKAYNVSLSNKGVMFSFLFYMVCCLLKTNCDRQYLGFWFGDKVPNGCPTSIFVMALLPVSCDSYSMWQYYINMQGRAARSAPNMQGQTTTTAFVLPLCCYLVLLSFLVFQDLCYVLGCPILMLWLVGMLAYTNAMKVLLYQRCCMGPRHSYFDHLEDKAVFLRGRSCHERQFYYNFICNSGFMYLEFYDVT